VEGKETNGITYPHTYDQRRVMKQTEGNEPRAKKDGKPQTLDEVVEIPHRTPLSLIRWVVSILVTILPFYTFFIYTFFTPYLHILYCKFLYSVFSSSCKSYVFTVPVHV